MQKIQINFKAIFWSIISKTIRFIALNLFRLSLFIAGYFFYIINVLSEWAILLTAFIGQHFGVRFNGVVLSQIETGNEPVDDRFDQKFTKDDIEQIASSIDPNAKIKEIEERLGVSYRQARKIQQAAKTSVPIRHYSFADKIA